MIPSRTKFRKAFKGKIHGNAYSCSSICFGSFGLKALEPGRLTSAQIESARRCVSRVMKKTGKLWIRMFPHMPVTAKPTDVRMGGGKGGLDRYVAVVRPGNIIFEVEGIDEETAKSVLSLAGMKLPFDVKFVKKEEGVYAEYK